MSRAVRLGVAGSRKGRRRAALAAALLFVLLGCSQAQAAGPRATIRWTAHGIPHVLAHNYRGLGFGYGYALASQNICVLADSYVTVDGRRSRYFGPDGSYAFRGNGTTVNNLNSDFFFQRIKDDRTVQKLIAQPPPNGPLAVVKRAVRGYVAGYNRYLADTGVDNIGDPACRGAAWVRPITRMDAFRRFYQLGILASQGVAIDGIGSAQPPTPASSPDQPAPDEVVDELKGAGLPLGGIGSNAYGLGRQATRNGNGMLLGNPHFPWDGSERFFQAQLTIPGKLNVSGASLLGVPAVLIGYNDHLAWSHTVSTAYRFTPFQETLVPGAPKPTYLYDGQQKQMTAESVTVKVKTANGLEDRTRTLYSTQHGPVFTSLLNLSLFPWTATTAFTMGDANKGNFRYLNHFFATDRASSTRGLYRILKRYQGIPWVNTIAAGDTGRAFYADISVTPHVTDSQALTCDTAVGAATFQALRLPVLDGSRSACEWGSDPDAIEPGTFGPSHMPHLFRRDYVTNSNDSYWLANPEHPLEGFNRIIGDERTARSLRTRLGLRQVQQRLHGSDGLGGKRFTLAKLRKVVFGDRQYAGELLRDDLVAFCDANPTLNGTNGPEAVSAACPVLAAWDLHDNLDSKGAILFRRFASHLLSKNGGLVETPEIYATPFSASDPVNTPSGLNTSNPAVGQSLADAVHDLNAAGIPLDAPLRGYQYESRGNRKIPIHGGPGVLGVFNAINVSWSSPKGYPDVPHGSSYVQAVGFGRGCPRARTILTYSQSTDPSSPYFADQTRMFSRKRWVAVPFTEAQIAADPKLKLTVLGGGVAEPAATFGCAAPGNSRNAKRP